MSRLSITRCFVVALMLLSLFLASTSRVASAQMCYDNSTPFPLPMPRDADGNPTCGLGFHCPRFNASDPSTYPLYCAPPPDCIVKRAFGEKCDPQSDQEPSICEQGYYCPTPTDIYECPEGYYCTYATYEPRKCPALAICPKGSHKFVYLGGVVASICFIIAFVAMLLIYRLKLRFSTLKTNFQDATRFLEAVAARSPSSFRNRNFKPIVDNDVIINDAAMAGSISFDPMGKHRPLTPTAVAADAAASPSSPSTFVTVETREQAIEVLAGGFLKARSTKPLTYVIKDLKVWAPTNRDFSRKGVLYGEKAKAFEEARLLKIQEERRQRVAAIEAEANRAITASDDNNGDTSDDCQGDASGSPKSKKAQKEARKAEREKRRQAKEAKRQSLHAEALKAEEAEHVASTKRVPILRGVTATFAPATVTAIIGPGGSGKSTLLNALLGRLPDSWQTEGYVAVNGDSTPDVLRRLRRVTGSATQEEPLHRELTVYENLYYNAQTRLPADWTAEERQFFIAATIEALQLVPQRDMPIGDEESRGISGGQRRRCHIGIELVSAPYSLFLDEPTNGLDSTTALGLCSCLSAIATGAELTVVMAISQPRVEIWNQLDDIIVIGQGGVTVYQGKREDAQPFFEEVYGIVFDKRSNPADVIVDVVAAQGVELSEKWLKYLENPLAFHGKRKNKRDSSCVNAPDNNNNADNKGESEENSGSPMDRQHTTAGTYSAFEGVEVQSDVDETAERTVTETDDVAVEIPGAVCSSPTDHPEIRSTKREKKVKSRHKAKKRVSTAAKIGDEANSYVEPSEGKKSQQQNTTAEKPYRIVVERQNAPIWFQIYLVFARAMAKQLSDVQPFIVEQVVNVIVAAVLGMSTTGFDPYWSFKHYQLLSPPESDLLPQVFMYLCMALGIVCVMPGAGLFVNARETYYREAASGFNRFAYYFGTVLSLQPRIIMTSMIFATIYQIIPQLTADFGGLFLFVWLVASCSYVIGIVPAMIFSPASAPLVGCLGIIFFGCLSGFIEFPVGMKYISFGYWCVSLVQRYFQEPVAHAYEDMAKARSKWISDDIGLCVGITIFILALFHCTAFLLMTFVRRDKQR